MRARNEVEARREPFLLTRGLSQLYVSPQAIPSLGIGRYRLWGYYHLSSEATGVGPISYESQSAFKLKSKIVMRTHPSMALGEAKSCISTIR